MDNKLNDSIRVILIIVFSMLFSCATTPRGQQGSSKAYLNQGYYFASKGEYDQAISDFSKALEIAPWFESAYSNRARAYCLKKSYDKSWDDVKKAQERGYQIPPEFIEDLRKASGRQE